MRRLLAEVIGPRVGPAAMRHDAAVLDIGGRVALTTDSFVVHPRAFPGGDIGKLAICGTVNDLAAGGARPLALTLSLILEEGLAIDELRSILASAAGAAAAAGVEIVTGDTKVVERGRGHGVYINTAGVGSLPPGREVGPWRVRPGDVALLSGDVGRHGVAILTAREELGLTAPIESDCAPITEAAEALWSAGVGVRCLRDPTRGGLAAALTEIASGAGVDLEIDGGAVPVSRPVRSVCELLGMDPWLMACEGRFVAFVGPADAERALAVLRAHDPAAARIGAAAAGEGRVWRRDAFGGEREVILPLGDPLPRIC